MYTKKELEEMENMTKIIHENSKRPTKKVVKEEKEDVLTYVLISCATVFFTIGLLFLINAIENFNFTWSLF